MALLEVIPMILREMKRNHFSLIHIARKLDVKSSTVKGMLSRPTMQVQKLAELSEIFNYNFFREIAKTLPYTEPNYAEKVTEDTEKVEMKERIKALEMEVGILRQTLKDVVSR